MQARVQKRHTSFTHNDRESATLHRHHYQLEIVQTLCLLEKKKKKKKPPQKKEKKKKPTDTHTPLLVNTWERGPWLFTFKTIRPWTVIYPSKGGPDLNMFLCYCYLRSPGNSRKMRTSSFGGVSSFPWLFTHTYPRFQVYKRAHTQKPLKTMKFIRFLKIVQFLTVICTVSNIKGILTDFI